MLSALTQTPTEDLPAEETEEVPWRQRIEVLKASLGYFAQSIFEKYEPQLDEKIKINAKRKVVLKLLHERILKALASEDSLSEDRIYVLGYAQKSLRIKNSGILQSKEDLVLALRGVHEKLISELRKVEFSQSLACEVIRRIQVKEMPGFNSMLSSPATLEQCAL